MNLLCTRVKIRDNEGGRGEGIGGGGGGCGMVEMTKLVLPFILFFFFSNSMKYIMSIKRNPVDLYCHSIQGQQERLISDATL